MSSKLAPFGTTAALLALLAALPACEKDERADEDCEGEYVTIYCQDQFHHTPLPDVRLGERTAFLSAMFFEESSGECTEYPTLHFKTRDLYYNPADPDRFQPYSISFQGAPDRDQARTYGATTIRGRTCPPPASPTRST